MSGAAAANRVPLDRRDAMTGLVPPATCSASPACPASATRQVSHAKPGRLPPGLPVVHISEELGQTGSRCLEYVARLYCYLHDVSSPSPPTDPHFFFLFFFVGRWVGVGVAGVEGGGGVKFLAVCVQRKC